ncbi:hypothetical protein [Nocardia sp. NPDC003963]
MSYAKLKYDGNSYSLDSRKVAVFLDDLREAALSDKPKLLDVPVAPGKGTLFIAVGQHTPVAVLQSESADKDEDEDRRRAVTVL